jgi:hypothetical protein
MEYVTGGAAVHQIEERCVAALRHSADFADAVRRDATFSEMRGLKLRDCCFSAAERRTTITPAKPDGRIAVSKYFTSNKLIELDSNSGWTQRRESMRKLYGGVILFASIAILAIAVPVRAQTTAQTMGRATAVPAAPRYEASKEVTLQGNVLDVVTKPPAGTLIGTHVIVATSSGDVDAHLGSYAMKGANAFTLTPGERVQLVGVMTTSGANRVFLVRTIQSGSHVYKIRNEHGFLLRPVKASKGGQA